MTWRNVLRDSLDKLEAGIYEIDMMKIRRGNFARNGPKIPVTRSTPVCKMCAYQCLAQLAYQYRRDIPVDDLPGEDGVIIFISVEFFCFTSLYMICS